MCVFAKLQSYKAPCNLIYLIPSKVRCSECLIDQTNQLGRHDCAHAPMQHCVHATDMSRHGMKVSPGNNLIGQSLQLQAAEHFAFGTSNSFRTHVATRGSKHFKLFSIERKLAEPGAQAHEVS
jgi:hypothetical protein